MADEVLLETPGPSILHQCVAARMANVLVAYVDASGVGEVFLSPAALQPLQGALVAPDVFVAPLVDGRRESSWSAFRHLVLAIEVLAPDTARRDRVVNRRLYQEFAQQYWIVDPDARLVERWRPSDRRPEVVDGVLNWRPEGAAEPFLLDLPAFFRKACDDPEQHR